MKDLRGRTAVITGAASGIGLGIAHALGDAGMDLVLSDIEPDPLDAGGEGGLGLRHARPRGARERRRP